MPTKKGAKVSKKTNNVGKSNSVAEGAVTEPELALSQGASNMEIAEEGDTRTVAKTKKVLGLTAKKVSMSATKRAGLQFSVMRFHRNLVKETHGTQKVEASAAVYGAGIIEYLVAELLELAGNASKDLKARTISPRHIQLAIRGDEELDTLIKATIAGGGVIPHVHKSLLAKKSS